MTYPEALRYLDSFVDYERFDNYDYQISFSLDRMRHLSRLLGDPQDGIRSIHIAGSKGKGSTAAFTYSILRSSHFKTGLYTSPHLVSFRERIRVDDEPISEVSLARLLGDIRDVMAGMADDKPTFFEVCTALAYLYFREKRVDFAVYETGLGGRLDATNIIHPLVTVITPISYEHTQKLGRSLKEIANEKCGIIKPGVVCVSAPQEAEALEAIERVCRERLARLILAGRDITFEGLHADDRGTTFNVSGISGEYRTLRTGLLGEHQVMNAAAAIGAVETLASSGVTIHESAIRSGVEKARWEGRLEVVGRRPYVVLDGAQNRASAGTLARAVREIFQHKKLILVLGVSKDKDVAGILAELLPMSGPVFLTRARVAGRALEPSRIKEIIVSGGSDQHPFQDIAVTADVKEALDTALAAAGEDDLVLITGSLFVVGEARALLSRR